MRRPWYTYVLLFVGILFMLGALFRPVVGATSVAPGARITEPDQRLQVEPGGPLDRAGIRTGDLLIHSDVVEPAHGEEQAPVLRWTANIPRSGTVTVMRERQRVDREVRPARPWLPVRLLWMVVGLLNVALTALALALFWQRPRDGQAALLGLVLLFAPVFAFPGEWRLLSLALAAHFFTVFPTDPHASRRRRLLVGGIYFLFVFLGLTGNSLWKQGHIPAAIRTYNTLALFFAGYSVVRVLLRWRRATPEARPLYRTAALAAVAILLAVIGGFSQRGWVVRDQFIPANLLPALLFGGAVGHLVFRLRALEVRLTARRTLHYLLARWTLGSLFLIPGFMLVWRLGQLSATHSGAQPGEVFFLLLWMFITALLLGKRSEVLRNLDRRFFRDAYAARQALLHLAGELGGQPGAGAVVAALEAGVRRALRPRSVRFEPDAVADALVLPVRHGERLYGYLSLGEKESGEEYTGEERELLESVAAHAGTALETARLSAELLERQRAELAVRSAGVLSGAEEERRRLAADLHDHVLPELRAIAGEVEQLQSRANGLAPDLEQLGADVRVTMDSVREVMEALRPSALDMLGLWDALESLARRAASRANPPVNVSVRRRGEEPDLSPEQSLTLYRIVQEAVQNALRHAGASRIGLVLEGMDGALRITVWDDGRGFDPALVGGGGRGLGNIRYRADLAGAEVRWAAREEGGTEVRVTLQRS